MSNCVACNTPLDPANAPYTTHPNCLRFEEPGDGDPFSSMMKQKLTEIITWYDKQNPRSYQQAIGPSEIGDLCDRRIGYRLAGLPGCNTEFDPWSAIVGTACHAWLDNAFKAWMKEHDSTDWSTETTLQVGDFIEGHADLYNHTHQAVIDWKTAGTDVMKRVIKEGPSPGYMIQTHVYGWMFSRAGWPVRKVSLVFLPRAGLLKNMYVWSADYDPSVAEAAMDRVFRIAQELMSMDVLTESHRWELVPAHFSNNCGFCPFYDPGRDLEQGADATGCPGR